MTIEEAAESLDKHLQNHPGFTAVGVGTQDKPVLYLYVKDVKNFDNFLVWEGYPIEIRKMGKPRLAVDDEMSMIRLAGVLDELIQQRQHR